MHVHSMSDTLYALAYCTLLIFCADQELCRRVPSQTRVGNKSPALSGSPKLRTAERSRKEKLGFLDERPSFQPKIIHQVPDFSKLHKALQTAVLRKTQSKDTLIKCQPFYLRTSALPARQRKMSPENSQVKHFFTPDLLFLPWEFVKFCYSFIHFNAVWSLLRMWPNFISVSLALIHKSNSSFVEFSKSTTTDLSEVVIVVGKGLRMNSWLSRKCYISKV